MLIFDHLEEVLTTSPADREAKREFFAQVGLALRDRNLWALFVIREDFVAELDPYARLIPTRFANRYRLDLLEKLAALDAITLSARDSGVTFQPDVLRSSSTICAASRCGGAPRHGERGVTART